MPSRRRWTAAHCAAACFFLIQAALLEIQPARGDWFTMLMTCEPHSPHDRCSGANCRPSSCPGCLRGPHLRAATPIEPPSIIAPPPFFVPRNRFVPVPIRPAFEPRQPWKYVPPAVPIEVLPPRLDPPPVPEAIRPPLPEHPPAGEAPAVEPLPLPGASHRSDGWRAARRP